MITEKITILSHELQSTIKNVVESCITSTDIGHKLTEYEKQRIALDASKILMKIIESRKVK